MSKEQKTPLVLVEKEFIYVISSCFLPKVKDLNITFKDFSNFITNQKELKVMSNYNAIYIITEEDFITLSNYVEELTYTPNFSIVLIAANKLLQDFVSHSISRDISLVIPILPLPLVLSGIISSMENSIKIQYNLGQTIIEQKYKIQELLHIGEILSQEKDLDKLLSLILYQMRQLVYADSGSIYIIERNKETPEPTHIRFKISSLHLSERNEFLLPIDNTSIAGYVALTGKHLKIDDVYTLDSNTPFQFNYDYDKKYKYKTKSMLVIPLKNIQNKVIGVIQLLNKQNFKKATSKEANNNKDANIIPFSNQDLELINFIAGSAAISIENNLLLQDIRNLFEGFVTASVTAIEQRDPSTSGHSFRVAKLTVSLAEAVDRLQETEYANVKFSKEQIQEIRYASLLHDFGKVGVREQVLVKPKKLYQSNIDNIFLRYHLLKKQIEETYLNKKIKLYESKNFTDKDFKILDAWKKQELHKVENLYQDILKFNEPHILPDNITHSLSGAKDYTIMLDDNLSIPFLKENEILDLSIKKGSLNLEERKEIESHVVYTYNFLKQIPWTDNLKYIPKIAQDHHEKLNGSGYPLGIKEKDIFIQTRMMTISDIFDALTARDRPYKKEISKEKALDILKYEVTSGNLDSTLFDIFVKLKIYDQVA